MPRQEFADRDLRKYRFPLAKASAMAKCQDKF